MRLKWKHIVVGLFALTIAFVIFLINRRLGNSIARSWPISAFLLGIAYLPFALTWAVKDTWRARWARLERNFPLFQLGPTLVSNVPFSIPVDNAAPLRGHIFSPNTYPPASRGCVLLLHGYSDTQATLAYLVDFLLRGGFCVVTYDARGIGESRRAGRKNDFLSKISVDVPRVITLLQEHPAARGLPLAVVGFSMGASPALIDGALDPRVRAVVAVSGLSDRNQNLPWTWNPFKVGFWLRVRFSFLGVPYRVPAPVNAQISPVLALAAARQTMTPVEWARVVTNRVFLVHCINDKTIRIDHFRANVSAFDLPPSQAIVLSRGGHTYLRAELLLASTLLRAFDASFPPSTASKI